MANEVRLIDANALRDDTFILDSWDAKIVRAWLDDQPTVDAVEVVHGWWEWFEEWNPSTPDHPRECDDCGWRCGKCKTSLADMVGGYWDDYYEEPKLNYCPNCGAKMDGDGNA